MRGITGAADSLSDAIKERKQKSQKAASLRKTIGVYSPEMKDEVQTMSLADLEGYVAGIGMKAAKDKLAQEMALKRADDRRADQFLKLNQDQFNAAQQQREAQGRMSEILARYAAAPASLGEQFATGTAGMDQPAGLTLDRYLAAAGEAKAQPDPRVLEQFIQNGQRQGLAVDPRPLPFEAGDMKGVYSPKTGQFQADRPDPIPKDARMTVVLERDDMDRPTRTWTGSPKQYEEQFGKPLPGAPAAATAPDEDALVQEALAKATTDEQRATIRELYKQRTGRVLK